MGAGPREFIVLYFFAHFNEENSIDFVKSEEEWKSKCLKSYEIQVEIKQEYENNPDVQFWFFGVHNASGDELYRKDFNGDMLEKFRKENTKHELITFRTNDRPTKYIIWPCKKETGWGQRYEIPINV